MVKSLDSWSQFLAHASEEILSQPNRTFVSTQPCFIPTVSYFCPDNIASIAKKTTTIHALTSEVLQGTISYYPSPTFQCLLPQVLKPNTSAAAWIEFLFLITFFSFGLFLLKWRTFFSPSSKDADTKQARHLLPFMSNTNSTCLIIQREGRNPNAFDQFSSRPTRKPRFKRLWTNGNKTVLQLK